MDWPSNDALIDEGRGEIAQEVGIQSKRKEGKKIREGMRRGRMPESWQKSQCCDPLPETLPLKLVRSTQTW